MVSISIPALLCPECLLYFSMVIPELVFMHAFISQAALISAIIIHTLGSGLGSCL